jgi:hypothetical protein
MSREVIEAFLEEMRRRHEQEIEAIQLPEGTQEYLLSCMAEEDVDTLVFMLKLAYLMGLQTGYAVYHGEDDASPPPTPKGPLQA